MMTQKGQHLDYFTNIHILQLMKKTGRKMNTLLVPDMQQTTTLCPKKNIPDFFNCNLKTNYWILIIFGMNIPDTTCHQMTVNIPDIIDRNINKD